MQPQMPVIISAAGRGTHVSMHNSVSPGVRAQCVQLRTPDPSWIWAHCDTKQGRGSSSAISAGVASSSEIILHSFRYPVLKKADYESHAASATLPSQGEKKIDLQLPMGFDLDGETLAETHCNLLLTAQFSFRLPQHGVS